MQRLSEPAATPASDNVRHRVALIGWLSLVTVLAAIGFASRFTEGKPEEDVLYEWGFSIGGAIQYAFILVLLLLIARHGRVRDLFALHRPLSWPRALGLALLVLLGIFAVSLALSPFLEAGREQGLTQDEWDSARAAAYFASAAVIVIAAPIVEELSYRGLGFSLLLPWGQRLAVAVTALLFALGHGLVYAFPVLFAFGLGLGILRARTGSVLPGIALHAFFNASALALALAS